MDQAPQADDRRNGFEDGRQCEAELHIRLCARRLSTGHMQFHWRVEHLFMDGEDADSLKGTFAPFTMPHEAGQEIGTVVRNWWKKTYRQIVASHTAIPDSTLGEQLTLREFLRD